jgi:uncharacterized surface protein with fasciclin (FAS1) repeats
VVAAACGLILVLSGCATAMTSADGAPSPVSGPPPSPSARADAAAQPLSDQPFGPGCGAIPPAGEGSFTGMADDPVAVAVSHSPALVALTGTIRAAQLGPSLDAQQHITILAPVDTAFAAVPRDAMGALLADTPRLTAMLTHHVIDGRLTPERLAGTHTTLNNDQLTIDVSAEAFTVAAEGTLLGKGAARVVCGNVQTANATIYLIDQVLTSPAP